MSVGSSQFKGRVGFTNTMPSRDVSLYINNTQESDSGRYLCQIIMPENSGLTELSLDVKGKMQRNETCLHRSCTSHSRKTWPKKDWTPYSMLYNLTKLCNPLLSVPPAVPKCSLSGKPVLKGNVTLSCRSSSGKPIPIYKWRKTSPTSEVFFSPMLSEWS